MNSGTYIYICHDMPYGFYFLAVAVATPTIKMTHVSFRLGLMLQRYNLKVRAFKNAGYGPFLQIWSQTLRVQKFETTTVPDASP